MANTYVVRLEIDDKGAQKSIQRVESGLEKVKVKAASPGGMKGNNFFGGLEKQADTLDNLFGKLGGSSLAVADTFKVLRTALIGTGIGALVVLVGELINNFDSLKGAVDGVSSAQEDLLATQQESAALSKEQLTDITDRENILRLEKKTEEEILKIKIKAVDAAIIDQKAALETQKAILETQVEAEKRNKRIIKGIIDFTAAPLKLILMGVDQVGKAFGQDFGLAAGLDRFTDAAAGFVFDPEEVRKEGDAAIKEQEKALTQLENQRAGFILTQQKGASDAAKARADARAKELEAEKKHQQEILKGTEELFQEILKEFEAREKAEAAARVRANDQRMQQVEDQFKLEQELSLGAKDKEIAALVAKYDERFAIAVGNAELEKQLAEQQGKDIDEINQKYADAEIARQEQVQKARLDIASSTLTAFIALNNSFEAKNKSQAKRQFEINKALQIAQALIQTYQAATAAYASQLSIPSPDAPIRAAAAATVAVLAGLAQVNNIRKTKFDSTGGSAGGAPSVGNIGGGASGPPSFNPVNTDFINNRPPQPVLAYTLAGNVSSAQEADQKVKDQARL